MIQQLGDFPTGSTIRFMWNTNGQDGASITRGTNGTLRIYKNSSTVERSSSNGITDTEDFDALTGVHHCAIDLSDNTDAGFYAAGNEYFVVLVGAVIDTKTVNACLAHFSIVNRTVSALSTTAGNTVADALLDRADAIETGVTPRQSLRAIASSTAGKLAGAATSTVTTRNMVADTKTRLTVTNDADGNRTAITYDLT